jgi:hypothetical protein
VGYYILLDVNGTPLSTIKADDNLGKLKEQLNKAAAGTALGGLIESTGFTIGQFTKSVNADPKTFINKYIELVDEELESQLKNGVYGPEVKVSKPTEVYYTMLSRVLESKQTRLLYIPKELVGYFAFYYDDNGVGKSLLEDTKVFGSLRAILMFAEVMAGVKGAVGRTRLDITLDGDDPDPNATVEAIIQHFSGMQTEALPLGRLAAGDIVRALQKAGIEVNIDGGEAFPGTKTEVTDSTREYHSPDSELSDKLRRMQYSGFGIPPEIVDSAMEGELATVVVSRNQLYAKQVMEYASSFEKMASSFIRTYIRCSGELLGIIRDAVGEEKTLRFIESIELKLPSPDLAGVRSQAEAFTEYSEAVDKVVESYVTSDMLSDWLNGEVDSAMLSSLRISIANLMKREWLTQQNIFPEIATKLASGEVSDRIIEYNATTLKSLEKILTKLAKAELKVGGAINKAREPEPEPEEEEEEPMDDSSEEPTDDSGDLGTDTEESGEEENTDALPEEGEDDLGEDEIPEEF